MTKQRKRTPKLAFLGLNAVDQPADGLAFQKRHGWTWPSLSDPRRVLALRLGADYQPAFILVDARGRIAGGFQAAGTVERWNRLIALVR